MRCKDGRSVMWMPDRDMIIKGCENWVNNHKGENYLLTYSSVVELLAMLKEMEAEILQLEAELDILRNIYKQENPYRQAVKFE